MSLEELNVVQLENIEVSWTTLLIYCSKSR